ncbi:hypothetical protein JCM8097_009421 [Rhodosporidiobolus ruineniae]
MAGGGTFAFHSSRHPLAARTHDMTEEAATSTSSKRGAPSRQQHACSLCNKVFSRAEYVRRHFLSKHSLKAIECDKCDATFSRQDLLVRHTRIFHAGSAVPKPPAPTYDLDLPAPVPVPEGALPAVDEPTEDGEADGALTGQATASAASAERPSPPPPSASIDIFGSPIASDDSVAAGSAPVDTFSPTSSSLRPSPPQKRIRFSEPEISVDAALPLLAHPGSTFTFDLPPAVDTSAFDPTEESFAAFLQQLAPSATPYDASDLSLDLQGPELELPQPDTLALVRPRNWAVQALPGDEEEWEDEDGSASAELELIGRFGGGRSKQPCVWPDHLFVSRRGHGSRFFMPSQRFCIAYLYPWEIPPLPRLSRFAAQAYVSLLPILPLVHRPTLTMTELAPPFAFGLSVVGAGLFESYSDFHKTLSHAKRDFAAEHLSEVIVHEQERMPRVQTLLLYQLVGAFGNSLEERDYTRHHHPQLIQSLLDIVPPTTSTPEDLDLPPQDLKLAWREWVDRETYKRVAFLCYLLDIQTGASFGEETRLLSHSHPLITNLALPASEEPWNAGSATEWRAALGRTAGAPILFKDALNALLSRLPPKHDSPTARILTALPRQSPFAITILFQTLASLQGQIASSQRLLRGFANPPMSTLGGSAMADLDFSTPAPRNELFEAAAKSAQESIERISFGSRFLRLLCGASAAPGWFKGVEPIFQ